MDDTGNNNRSEPRDADVGASQSQQRRGLAKTLEEMQECIECGWIDSYNCIACRNEKTL